MPKQAGIFKIIGTMDDASFFKTKDGYLVRKKKTRVADSKGGKGESDGVFER